MAHGSHVPWKQSPGVLDVATASVSVPLAAQAAPPAREKETLMLRPPPPERSLHFYQASQDPGGSGGLRRTGLRPRMKL